VIVPVAEIAPGAKGDTSVTLYAGPQEQSALKQVASGLDLVVDYGWLTVVAAPMFWALEAIHKLVGNWGWAIVVLTILKAVFFPLSAAPYKSMAKMKKLTPRLMQLKERYGDDKQRLNQEMMEAVPDREGQSARRLPAHPDPDSGLHRPLLCCSVRSKCATRRGSAGSPTGFAGPTSSCRSS
jgi:hypothetical protein